MRGLSAGGGTAATVGFYLDETPLSANAVALNGRTVIDPDLFDLNHVEVLRGPQGTLYGSGSMGGTIRLTTNQPKLGTYEAATDVNVSDTSHGSANGGGSLMVNLPIGDIAALRMVTTGKYVSGWIDRIVTKPGDFPAPTAPSYTASAPANCGAYYCDRGDVADAPVQNVVKGSNLERFASARAILLVKPNDSLSITATGMYQDIRADGYNNFQEQPGGLAIYQPYDQQEPYHDYFRLGSLKVEQVMDFATLTSATSVLVAPGPAVHRLDRGAAKHQQPHPPGQRRLRRQLHPESVRRSRSDPAVQRGIAPDLEQLRAVGMGDRSVLRQSALGVHHLQSSSRLRHGADLRSAVGEQSGGRLVPRIDGCPGHQRSALSRPQFDAVSQCRGRQSQRRRVQRQQPQRSEAKCRFRRGTYKFTDTLKLTAGLRFFHFAINNLANQAGLGTAAANQDHTILSQSASGNAVLPKLNLAYEPTSDLTVYGTIAKGSRPGGFNLPIPLPTASVLAINPYAYNCGVGAVNVSSQPNYTPDSVWSAEIGEKARFADRRITVNADFYYIKWDNIQQVLSLTCGYPYNTNAGNAKSYGPEIEMSALLTTGLTFDMSGTFTQAYINDPNASALASGITPGTRVLNVPKYTAVAGLNYQVPINEQLNGLFHLSSSLVGPNQDQAAVRQTLPSYNLVDGRAGVASGPWSAAVFGTNLTNKVAEQTINNTVFAWQTYAITRVSTNQPRTIGVDFQYKF
jgi:iron complex outermembrane receptor protein